MTSQWKSGDIVRLNDVWGRQTENEQWHHTERAGDVCVIIEPAGSSYHQVWKVLHCASNGVAVFHESYFDRVEG
jgi:hypothetical protein